MRLSSQNFFKVYGLIRPSWAGNVCNLGIKSILVSMCLVLSFLEWGFMN